VPGTVTIHVVKRMKWRRICFILRTQYFIVSQTSIIVGVTLTFYRPIVGYTSRLWCYRLQNDLLCVEWDVKLYSLTLWCYSAVYYSNVDGDLYCWIGLYRSASDNSHYWLDGNPSTYRNWDYSEPDNDQCVYIKNGQFRDITCSSRHRYVCKGI